MENIILNCFPATNSFYRNTIEHVIENVSDAFMEEGYDEDMLRQLKMLWINKIENHHRNRNQGEMSSPNAKESDLEDTNKPELDETTMDALKCLPPNITSKVVQSNFAKNVLSPKPIDIVEKKVIIPQKSDDLDETDDSDDSLDESSDTIEDTKEDINSEESLNSEDDYTDDDENEDPFYTENLILCQYSFVDHTKNRWRFNFSNGIMCLNGEEYVFSSAKGDAVW
nr:transcription initiation factor IIA subunit 1-like [Onthophagus taurus]